MRASHSTWIGGITLIAAIAALPGCATSPPPASSDARCARAGGTRELQADLLFGRDIAGRGPVTDTERARFVADVVTPRFPDGLTTWDTRGQWLDRDTSRIVHEESFVIRIVAPDSPATLDGLAAIRRAYIERFRQQSVGLVLTRVCASF
ncbi:DUF3574 domain-containing protein [Burkholderia thailandensis]|uniref:DUF3574 domain-containing protein n=3 Tax=Burkholderia thailandensis TaxID=57975 RepID=A0AAW9CSQ2_BURTH|nr:DUF3574 domain-containing protein [Burkholderia thailandensis]AHI63525.1 hypothetical protein BTL_1767 [Burkholderia thailandensis H0587]AIP62456.1 hypothetical protein DR62_3146 [Burkholderia thailandensis]AOI51669.1 hypothetical protein WI24_07550 [Burkholderia thailandensis]AOJ50681.1 hypothetical protein AQ475_07460 [Burkholderia thailandensis]AVR26100.1 DUF3574 domain-containing protein [Burkholderia thailandensis]